MESPNLEQPNLERPNLDTARKYPRRDDPRMYTAEFSALTSKDLQEAGIDSAQVLRGNSPAKKLPFNKGFIWVAIGGGIGGVLRFFVGLLLPTLTTFTLVGIPWGTLFINSFGCILIGLLMGFVEMRPNFDERLKLLLGTGFCGGFTTMSAFALENAVLFGSNNSLLAMEYMAATAIFCLLGASFGFWVGCKIPVRKSSSADLEKLFNPEPKLFEVPSKSVSSNPASLNSDFTSAFPLDPGSEKTADSKPGNKS